MPTERRQSKCGAERVAKIKCYEWLKSNVVTLIHLSIGRRSGRAITVRLCQKINYRIFGYYRLISNQLI